MSFQPRRLQFICRAVRVVAIFFVAFALIPALRALADQRCTLPGVTLATDPTGDASGTAQQDIQSLSIAQPYDPAIGGIKVYFTLKVANLSPTPQPDSRWITYFVRFNGDGSITEWFVAMVTSTGSPAFVYGHTTGTGNARQLVIDGTPDSGNFNSDGTITISIGYPTANSGGMYFPPFSQYEGLGNIYSETRTSSVLSSDIIADSTTKSTYQVIFNDSCAPTPTPAPSGTPAPTATPYTTPQATFHYTGVSRLVADPVRPRIYGTARASNSVLVFDSDNLTLLKTIPIGSAPVGLAVSADRSKLWVANSASTTAAIGVIDLETLNPLPSLAAPAAPFDVKEGVGQRLYLTSTSFTDGIMQVNWKTGAYEGGINYIGNGFLGLTPDRKTLFWGDRGSSPSSMSKFSVAAARAQPLQQERFDGANGLDLKVSHNGQMLVYPNGAGNGKPAYTTFEIPTADITATNGSFNVGAFPTAAVFSNDDTLLYHGTSNQNVVKIFDTKTFAQVGSISLVASSKDYNVSVSDLAIDRSGKWLFVATNDYSTNGDVRIYPTGRTDQVVPPPLPTPTPPAQSLNISTRGNVQTDDHVLIGGFIVTGSESKEVLLRAIGPSTGVAGALADPTLELHMPNGQVVSNDNWKFDDRTQQTQEAQIRGTGIAPSNDLESAVLARLAPGSYTTIVRGKNNTSGIGLVEAYDLGYGTDSMLANISTRGVVGSSDAVLIGGFIVGPADAPSSKIAVRAIGPSLPVADNLQDPLIELHDSNGVAVATNDNWQDDPSANDIRNYQLAPADPRESAMIRPLKPGSYTAVVRGANGGAGVGLVEIYNLR